MGGKCTVIIVGNLGRDPEVKKTTGGMTVVNFSVATSRKKKNGEENTEWHNMTAFGKTGELIAEHMKKGEQHYFEGFLDTSSWDDPTSGKKLYKTNIIVEKMTFLNRSTQSQGQPQAPNQGYGSTPPVKQPPQAAVPEQHVPSPNSPPPPVTDVFPEDELPF